MQILQHCMHDTEEGSDLGEYPRAPHQATISMYIALSSLASTAASDQKCFVWDSSKGKSTGSDHCLTCKWYYNLTKEVQFGLAAGITLGHHILPSPACPQNQYQPLLATNYTLFVIVVKVNQLAQETFISCSCDMATLYLCVWVSMTMAVSITMNIWTFGIAWWINRTDSAVWTRLRSDNDPLDS
jgi:hypothetical protein